MAKCSTCNSPRTSHTFFVPNRLRTFESYDSAFIGRVGLNYRFGQEKVSAVRAHFRKSKISAIASVRPRSGRSTIR